MTERHKLVKKSDKKTQTSEQKVTKTDELVKVTNFEKKVKKSHKLVKKSDKKTQTSEKKPQKPQTSKKKPRKITK